jgi:serine-type D-Ala-D-Ala carboxypeptidase/endopeptidase (penicillin-binding protein 4)
MNLHADTLINLLAVKHGQRTFDEGMALLLPFVQKTGLNPDDVSLSDGRGNDYADQFSPRTVAELLRYMATRPDFAVYHDSLPVLGVDGTEATSIPPDSPLAGKSAAKSGTTAAGDLMHQRLLLMTRGSAGYMTTKSGRELVYALYVMHVPLNQIEDLFPIISNLGTMAEQIYDTL